MIEIETGRINLSKGKSLWEGKALKVTWLG